MGPPEVRRLDYASRLPPGRRSLYLTTKVRLRRLLRNRKFRRRATGGAVAIVLLVVAGYVSDWVSAAGCERDTAVWLGRDFIIGRPFQVWQPAPPESAAIFAAAGMTPAPPGTGTGSNVMMPICGVPAVRCRSSWKSITTGTASALARVAPAVTSACSAGAFWLGGDFAGKLESKKTGARPGRLR